MLYRTLLFFFLFLTALSADLSPLPDDLIGGHVDAFTGEVHFQTIDLIAPASKPLVINRIFTNDSHNGLGCKWVLGHFGKIWDGVYSHGSEEAVFQMWDRDKNTINDKNAYQGQVSSLFLKCTDKIESRGSYGSSYWVWTSASGEERIYKNQLCTDWRRSDGLKVGYGYDKNRMPQHFSLISHSGETLFVGDVHHDGSHIRSINTRGSEVRYNYTDVDYIACLSGVEKTQGVDEIYVYNNARSGMKLAQRRFPEGRFFGFHYYENKDTSAPYSFNKRVKAIDAPAGPGGVAVNLYTFEYADKHYKKMTFVQSAIGGRKDYIYSRDGRLELLYEYLDGEVYLTEHLVWSNNGWLIEHKKWGPSEHLFSQRFYYDNLGNPIREELDGNHCGECGTRVIERSFERGLNTSQREGAFEIKTSYVPGTDLVEAKYVLYDGKIVQRDFSCHDDHGNVWLEIHDDGNTYERDDFSGVTCRRMKQAAVSRVEPHGVPLIVDSRIWTPSGGEVFLSRVEYEYTHFGKPTLARHIGADGTVLGEERWEYDGKENPILHVDLIGRSSRFHYDPNGNVTQKEMPDGRIFFHQYDLMNRLVSEKELWPSGESFTTYRSYDAMERVIAEENPLGGKAHYEYDTLNRLTKVISPEGFATSFRYSPTSATTYVDFSDEGTATVVRTLSGKPCLEVSPEGRRKSYRYNTDNELLEETRADGSRLVTDRDPLNRPLKETLFDAEGNEVECTRYRYEGEFLVETTGPGVHILQKWDERGLLAEEITPSGRTTMEYDPFGRLIRKIRHLENGSYLGTEWVKDAVGHDLDERLFTENGIFRRIYRHYDSGNRVVIETTEEAGETRTSRFSYFADGSPKEEVDPEGKTTLYHVRIERGGLLRTKVYHDGRVEECLMDNQARPIEKKDFSPAGELLTTTTYKRSALGQITTISRQMKNEVEEERLTYDKDGLRTSHTHVTALGGHRTEVSLYDAFGREVEKRLADKSRVHCEYNTQGQTLAEWDSKHTFRKEYTYEGIYPVLVRDTIQNTEVRRSYDAAGRLISETLPSGTVAYSYDALDRLTSLTLPDEKRMDYLWEGLFWRKATRSGDRSYTIEVERGYSGETKTLKTPGGETHFTYTQKGRRISSIHSGWEEQIEHDDRERIISHQRGHEIHRYSYTPEGFLAKEEGTYTKNYLYTNAGHRKSTDNIQHHLDSNALPTNGILHNARGERIHDRDKHLTYDGAGRMTRAETERGSFNYRYDSFGRRLSKESSGSQENYLWVGNHEVGTDKMWRFLAPFPETEAATLTIETPEDTLFAIPDVRGSIGCLVNSHGDVVEEVGESAFGPEGTSLSPWRLFGKRLDEETGYVYFGARYLDPKTGLFLSPDPLGYEAGPYPHAFALHDPVNNRDPFGLLSQLEDSAANEPRPRSAREERYKTRRTMIYKPTCVKNEELSNDKETVYDFTRNGKTTQATVYHEPMIKEIDGVRREIIMECDGSYLYRLPGDKLSDNKCRVCVNGVWNTISSFFGTCEEIQNGDGYELYCFYDKCETEGWWPMDCIRDVVKAHDIMMGRSLAIDFMSLALRHLTEQYGGVDRANILIICHSRGAALTQMACLDNPEIAKSCIEVKTFGAPLFCHVKHFRSIMHFVNQFDPVCFADRKRWFSFMRSDISIIPSVGSPFKYHDWLGESYGRRVHLEKKGF